MDETLARRIEQLEADTRRWKWVAGLTLVLTLVSVGASTYGLVVHPDELVAKAVRTQSLVVESSSGSERFSVRPNDGGAELIMLDENGTQRANLIEGLHVSALVLSGPGALMTSIEAGPDLARVIVKGSLGQGVLHASEKPVNDVWAGLLLQPGADVEGLNGAGNTDMMVVSMEPWGPSIHLFDRDGYSTVIGAQGGHERPGATPAGSAYMYDPAGNSTWFAGPKQWTRSPR